MKVLATTILIGAFVIPPGSYAFVDTQLKSSSSFQVSKRTTSSSLLMGGFLDGRAPRIDVRDKEDDAMWVDEDDDASGGGGWNNPFASKEKAPPPPPPSPAKAKAPSFSLFGQKKAPAPAPAPPPPPPKSSSGFKFPWDK